MFKILFSGNVGSDAVVREFATGKVICFDVAVSKKFKNSKGEKIDKTEWVKAAIWRSKDSDSKVADYIKKGKKILIEGIPHSSGYQDKNGDLQTYIEVNVKEFEIMN